LVLDLTRSRRELLAENALLSHQLLVAARQVKRPKLRATDRLVLVGLAAMFANWRNALVLVQPETLLRWHRDLFRRLWAGRTKPKTPPKPRLDEIHKIKDRLGQGPKDWIDPEGNVITGDENGDAVDNGPAEAWSED
jgi:hypothetical protein